MTAGDAALGAAAALDPLVTELWRLLPAWAAAVWVPRKWWRAGAVFAALGLAAWVR